MWKVELAIKFTTNLFIYVSVNFLYIQLFSEGFQATTHNTASQINTSGDEELMYHFSMRKLVAIFQLLEENEKDLEEFCVIKSVIVSTKCTDQL
jgi:hypothetical protein